MDTDIHHQLYMVHCYVVYRYKDKTVDREGMWFKKVPRVGERILSDGIWKVTEVTHCPHTDTIPVESHSHPHITIRVEQA